eukprot:scaffold870_cov268-Pinguiococcus_pyrenoidosus.AAC.12
MRPRPSSMVCSSSVLSSKLTSSSFAPSPTISGGVCSFRSTSTPGSSSTDALPDWGVSSTRQSISSNLAGDGRAKAAASVHSGSWCRRIWRISWWRRSSIWTSPSCRRVVNCSSSLAKVTFLTTALRTSASCPASPSSRSSTSEKCRTSGPRFSRSSAAVEAAVTDRKALTKQSCTVVRSGALRKTSSTFKSIVGRRGAFSLQVERARERSLDTPA